jgi:2-polyprenyl-3-methyl-5-hydroxy-6-metoxy-1,4-benzoquinol methylase
MTKSTTLSWDAASRLTDSFQKLPRQKLIEMARNKRWFHDFQFPDYRTGSIVYPEDIPANYHLLPIFDLLSRIKLDGANVLDIGTYDGLCAISAAASRAKHVDATCQFDLDRFRIARALSGVDNLAYHPNCDLRDIETEAPGAHYDIIIASAMMHHLTSPIELFFTSRKLLKAGGELIVESLIVPDSKIGLTLNTLREDPVFGVPTLWLPSIQALLGMLELSCFDVCEVINLTGGRALREPNYDRVTVRAHASTPKTKSSNTKLAEFHSKLDIYSGLDFDELRNQSESGKSNAQPPTQRIISIWKDRPKAPFHPSVPLKRPPAPPSLRVAGIRDFQNFKTRWPDSDLSWDDVSLLALNYPGEQMPEGMRWGLKQCGYLFVLDAIENLGATNVLELGPGFNTYLENKLRPQIKLDSIDSPGFYKPEVFNAIKSIPRRGSYFQGLLGHSSLLPSEHYDACVSVSALEHVPYSEINKIAEHLFTVVRPGGWSIHSIDARVTDLDKTATRWYDALSRAGFELPDVQTENLFIGTLKQGGPLLESNPILFRFHYGYQKDLWARDQRSANIETSGTLLVCAQRSPD